MKPKHEVTKIDKETIKRITERLYKKANGENSNQIKVYRDDQDENLGCSPVSLNQTSQVKMKEENFQQKDMDNKQK